MEQVYIVGLRNFTSDREDEFIDETSVDASSEEEALRVASDLFGEFYPCVDMEFIKAYVKVIEVKPITEDE